MPYFATQLIISEIPLLDSAASLALAELYVCDGQLLLLVLFLFTLELGDSVNTG